MPVLILINIRWGSKLLAKTSDIDDNNGTYADKRAVEISLAVTIPLLRIHDEHDN